jgi:hypothetical protein
LADLVVSVAVLKVMLLNMDERSATAVARFTLQL